MAPGLLVTFNADQVLTRWRTSAEFSVYLRDDATSEQRGVVESVLDQSSAVGDVEFVSKDQALVRFRREFADLASLASELDGNPFPASIEVRLLQVADSDGSGEVLLRRIATLPGVADVRYDRAWLARVGQAIETVRRVGFGLALLLATAAAVTVASVVRLGMHARREEIEIMELVGASAAYMRGPFVAEGLLQGGIGALVALGACCSLPDWRHGSGGGGSQLGVRRPSAAVPSVVPGGLRSCWAGWPWAAWAAPPAT